eukprot:TRINITY_DN8561_c0_g1_i2.p1 TRINITY_DN8561_c0_g1~~TRINITY_DN8561_c0_g1_i2.p1  ORF type:complete len:159 (+),score=44.87 TRINITY_DN8561_c0_g1_i2:64-540(+)
MCIRDRYMGIGWMVKGQLGESKFIDVLRSELLWRYFLVAEEEKSSPDELEKTTIDWITKLVLTWKHRRGTFSESQKVVEFLSPAVIERCADDLKQIFFDKPAQLKHLSSLLWRSGDDLIGSSIALSEEKDISSFNEEEKEGAENRNPQSSLLLEEKRK